MYDLQNIFHLVFFFFFFKLHSFTLELHFLANDSQDGWKFPTTKTCTLHHITHICVLSFMYLTYSLIKHYCNRKWIKANYLTTMGIFYIIMGIILCWSFITVHVRANHIQLLKRGSSERNLSYFANCNNNNKIDVQKTPKNIDWSYQTANMALKPPGM